MPQESENIGERAVRVQDKGRAAAVRAGAHAEMTVSTKVLVDNDSIIPLADGARGKFVVDHSLFYGAGSKLEIAVWQGCPAGPLAGIAILSDPCRALERMAPVSKPPLLQAFCAGTKLFPV